VFPAFFQATVRQRMMIWGGLLLLLSLLYGSLDVIHGQKLGAFLMDLDRAASAGTVERIKELHGEIVYHAAGNTRNKLLLSILIALLTVQIAALEYHWLVRPVVRLTDELSAGGSEPHQARAAAMRRDEVGVLGRAILAHYRQEADRATKADGQLSALSQQIAEQERFQAASIAFSAEIASIVEALRGHGGRMASASQRLSGISAELGTQAQDTSLSIRRSSDQVDSAADLVSNFAMTIQMMSEETDSVSQASGASCRIVDEAQADSRELSEAVSLIDQIVALISDVATRTNLLALNATIEAARAGEHGRGFAVVASEVKQLAQQTSQATSDASQRLHAVQAAANRITERMSAVVATVEGMDRGVQNIASVIRQEGENSLSVSQEAKMIAAAVREEADRVARIRDIVGESGVAAGTIAATSSDLSSKAGDLSRAFETFLAAVDRKAA
jgi:methyl-accepting chemotaxis protein